MVHAPFVDRNHRSVVCLRDGKVIGGICFRPFPDYGFLEIAFLAVSVDFQIRVRSIRGILMCITSPVVSLRMASWQGVGRHVLNHLKEFAKTQQLYYFLTYADNYAIGFFKKLVREHSSTSKTLSSHARSIRASLRRSRSTRSVGWASSRITMPARLWSA